MEVIKILIIIYLLIGVFQAGRYYEIEGYNYEKWYIKLVFIVFVSIFINILWVLDLIKDFIKPKIGKFKNWYRYLFKFKGHYTEKVIENIKKYHEPKAKGLDKILIKLIYKKYNRLNKNV